MIQELEVHPLVRLKVEFELLQPLALQRVHHGIVPRRNEYLELGRALAQVAEKREQLDRVWWRTMGRGRQQASVSIELPARDVDVASRTERRRTEARVVDLSVHQHRALFHLTHGPARLALTDHVQAHGASPSTVVAAVGAP